MCPYASSPPSSIQLNTSVPIILYSLAVANASFNDSNEYLKVKTKQKSNEIHLEIAEKMANVNKTAKLLMIINQINQYQYIWAGLQQNKQIWVSDADPGTIIGLQAKQ